MSKTISIPSSIKDNLKQIANKRKYVIITEIVNRGSDEELILSSEEEAQMIVNVARIEMLDAALRYPYWDDESPDYSEIHEDAFQDVQMGFFEKIVMYIGQEYSVVTSV